MSYSNVERMDPEMKGLIFGHGEVIDKDIFVSLPPFSSSAENGAVMKWADDLAILRISDIEWKMIPVAKGE